MSTPTVVKCPISTLGLLSGTSQKYDEVMKEHFEDGKCITCMDLDRDAIPWSELFSKGRQAEWKN